MTKQQQVATVGEWMRLPTRGYDPNFGLSRSWFYSAINAGLIRSSVLKRKGCLTGVRLVNVASVRELIEKNIQAGA